MNGIENSNPLAILSFPSLIPLLGRTATCLYEVIRNKAHQNKNNKCKINQTFLYKGTNIIPQNQSKLLKILENWKLVITNRNENKGIITYEVPEINFQLILFCPQKYKESVEKGTMIYFCAPLNFKHLKDKYLVEKIIENANYNGSFNIKKIEQNIKGLPHKSISPTNENNPGITNTFVGANRKNLKNIKETKVSSQQLKIVVNDFSKIGQEPPRTKLNRREQQTKVSTRDKLKAANTPCLNKTKPTAKRESTDKFYKGRSFNLVMKKWNSLSGKNELKKISELKEKQNITLDTSILATQALLSGRLFKTGITLPNRKIRDFYPPKYFVQEKIDLQWLLEKIDKFHKIVTDINLKPFDKTYLRNYTLGDFILGKKIISQTGEAFVIYSPLFTICCGDLKTAWEDPHPKLTKSICREYNLYTEQDKDFSGTELKLLSALGDRFVKFSKESDAKRSHTMGKGDPFKIAGRFFIAQNQEWRGKILEMNPKYFAGDHAWSVFEKRLEY